MPAFLQACGFWRGDPIILASRSAGRARVLEAAGIPFGAVDSMLDERTAPGVAGAAPDLQAAMLAREKARIVSVRHPDQVVLGADQTLAFEGRCLHKAPDLAAAIAQLSALAGQEHTLLSAVACMRNGVSLFEFSDSAHIRMRYLKPAAIEAYARASGDRLLTTVGSYEIEGVGANLLESVRGDMFTVIGMPLFRLLAEFRTIGLIEEGAAEK